ncbi:MAG: hypothetical protein H7Y20_03610 [Bryobacteraceae bacterium]|nr:hypothetical protein [Bryobacteraceae bacterium]
MTVEITDETGKPVDNAAVSFRLPEEGPGGTFVRGLRTEIVITTPDGRASVRELITGRTPGPFQIRVTAVKDAVRAGTVVDQYVSESAVKRSPQAKTMVASKGSSHKWVLWVAIAGGAAAAGLIAGMSKKSTPGAPAVVAPPATPPTLGTPGITIGRP